jgi:hypothetical protein
VSAPTDSQVIAAVRSALAEVDSTAWVRVEHRDGRRFIQVGPKVRRVPSNLALGKVRWRAVFIARQALGTRHRSCWDCWWNETIDTCDHEVFWA